MQQCKRFGFNGMEGDHETKGKHGADYNFNFRDYDARTARFNSIDLKFKEYPSLSTFAFAANNPIRFIDSEGLGVGDPPGPQIEKKEITRSDRILLGAATLAIGVLGVASAVTFAPVAAPIVIAVGLIAATSAIAISAAQFVSAVQEHPTPVLSATSGFAGLIGNGLAEQSGNNQYRLLGIVDAAANIFSAGYQSLTPFENAYNSLKYYRNGNYLLSGLSLGNSLADLNSSKEVLSGLWDAGCGYPQTITFTVGEQTIIANDVTYFDYKSQQTQIVEDGLVKTTTITTVTVIDSQRRISGYTNTTTTTSPAPLENSSGTGLNTPNQ